MTKAQLCRARCPACAGPMKTGAKVCTRCRIKNVCCAVCGQYQPRLIDSRCAECDRALVGLSMLARLSSPRPHGWTWPAGHIEALAARAAAGLPLFGGNA